MEKTNYELQSLRYGEYCVTIDFCANCREHNRSLRHDEQKYLEKALALKSHIQNEFPFVKIYLRPLNTAEKGSQKRLGLFEVNFGAFDGDDFVLMASKLTTLKWPDTRTVINSIRSRLESRPIYLQLQVPETINAHPKNNLMDSLRLALVSVYDFPSFLKNLQTKLNSSKRSRTAKSFIKKERTLSAVVKKKLTNGTLKKEELDELLNTKKFIYDLKAENGIIEHHSVKPGNYVLVVLENRNFRFLTHELTILPNPREPDLPFEESVELGLQDKAELDLYVEYDVKNPIVRINFRPCEKDIEATNESFLSTDGDITLHSSLTKNGMQVAWFKARRVTPGIYEVYLEFRNYQLFEGRIRLFQGFNEYSLQYPSLKWELEIPLDNQPIPSPKQEMPVIMEKPSHEEKYDKESSSKKSKTLTSGSKAEREFLEDKENMDCNSTIKSKKSSKSPSSKSSSKKSSKQSDTSFSSKSSRKQENQPVKTAIHKNRIASGNRIRPGERLTSAKSNSLNSPICNERKRESEYIKEFSGSISNDIVWESLDYHPGKLNLFIKHNNSVELKMDFLADGELDEDVVEEEDNSGYRHLTINFNKRLKLARIYLEKKGSLGDKKIELYVYDGATTRIDITNYLQRCVTNEEQFVDLCTVTNNGSKYKAFVCLVPLKEKPESTTGLRDLKSLVNFVQNSKFDVFRFFGFDMQTIQEDKDYTMSARLAKENLGNYELTPKDNYLLSAVRYCNEEMISLRKLEKVYPAWLELIGATEDVIVDLDALSEEDEPFELEEFEDEDFD